ncbi:MAG: discoidin domain-containing protein [Rhodanobacter sp.]
MAVAHRYWRIFVDATINASPNYINLAELELLTVFDGTDLTTPATPMTASSTYAAQYAPKYAVDNNIATFWHSLSQTSHWIAADLGASTMVRAVSMTAADNSVLGRMPKEFRVQYSDDGPTWFDYWVAPTQSPWALKERRVFALETKIVSGIAKLDTGVAANYVLVRDWTTHAHIVTVVPDVNGAWSVSVNQTNVCDVTVVGPDGYQPIIHGPIVPVASD